MSVSTARILADVQAGLVSSGMGDYITVPAGVPAAEHDEYRQTVIGLLDRSLVMRPASDRTPGVLPLLLTSLGSHVLLSGAANADRYRSAQVYEVRDSKVGVEAVTR